MLQTLNWTRLIITALVAGTFGLGLLLLFPPVIPVLGKHQADPANNAS